MRFKWSHGRGLLLVSNLLVLACLPLGCGRSHPKPPEVNKQEAEITTTEITEEQKSEQKKQYDWELKHSLDVFDSLHKSSSPGSVAARSAITRIMQVSVYGNDVAGYPELFKADLKSAIDAGCDDVYIRYLSIRNNENYSSHLELAQALEPAVQALLKSKYPAIRQYVACGALYDAYSEASRKDRGLQENAQMYLQKSLEYLLQVLNDKSTPEELAYNSSYSFIKRITRWGNEKELFDQMDEVLKKNWDNYSFSHLIRGEYYTDYAWVGRTGKLANQVTTEQWQLFKERLDIAEKCFLKGMEVNPKDGRIPTQMIRVVSGQEKGLNEMKRWYDKAMEADPNNYEACSRMLYFLEPKWFGSRAIMLKFAHQCVNNTNYGGTVPLILVDAHYNFNRGYGPKDSSYWLQKDVWPDIKLGYEKFFELNPNAKSYHNYYARYALWCEQWDTFVNEVNLLGEDIQYDVFGGRVEFEKTLTEAKSHVKK